MRAPYHNVSGGGGEVQAIVDVGPKVASAPSFHVPLDVVIASIGLPHDGRTLNERSLGGSETAAIHVSRALASRGHYVTVFSQCPERKMGNAPTRGGLMDGVRWQPLEGLQAYVQAMPHDVLVVSRDLNIVRLAAQSKVRILWCHDLALKRHRAPIASAMWNTDALYVLSPFQQAQYREIYGLPDDRLFVTRNGIDGAGIRAAVGKTKRDPLKLVYGSRPERGLETAIRVMDVLARRGSKLRLEVSWYDHEGLAPELQGYYAQLRAEAEKRPNMRLAGALVQASWHRQLASAQAMIYPGAIGPFAGFREISCIGLAEAQATGTPSIAVAKGAVPTTVRDAGMLIGDEHSDPGSPEAINAFADAVERMTGDAETWTHYHEAALAQAPGLDWAGVAEQWETHWYALIAARVADRWRMERYFTRMGEREGLRHLNGGTGETSLGDPPQPMGDGTGATVEDAAA